MASLLQAVKIVAILMAWFGIGAILLFTNRLLLTTSGLRAPISLTLLHMFACCIFAHGTILVGGMKWQSFQSAQQRFSVMKLALSFGLSVVAGVWALTYIPVSFSEMISSTTPLFTAIFAYLLLGEIGGNVVSYASLVMIAVGAAMASEGEPMWNTIGFCLAVFSVVLRAFKTVLQQGLLQCKEESLDSINLLRFISMYVVMLLIPAVVLIEGATNLPNALLEAYGSGSSSLPQLLLLNVSAAFLVNWVQMQVTKMIGATLLQVLGIFKGTLTAFLSVVFFGNPVTAESVAGYGIVVTSVLVYNTSLHFARKKKLSVRVPCPVAENQMVPSPTTLISSPKGPRLSPRLLTTKSPFKVASP